MIIAIVAMFMGGGGSKPTKATLTGSPAPKVTPVPTPKTQAVVTNATPSGPCADNSLQAIPSITGGVAGTAIAVDLTMTTTQPACTFAMSGKSLVLKVLSGATTLWSSQDCPNTISSGMVTLRAGQATTVSVTWDGHQSNGGCGPTHPWVGPGNYQVIASVVGSTPATSNFALVLPTPQTITKTATPTPTAPPTVAPTP